jgi:uncharacterized protein DUF2188
MGRSVKIRTRIPSYEEFVDTLGLSKARRRSLAPIIVERRESGDYAIRRSGSERASGVFPTQREAVERARELSPYGAVFVERVRDTTVGGTDKWRKVS